MRENFRNILNGVLNSYSQIFFSDSRFFSLLLILVSFADIYAGLAGMISVIVTNVTARMMGFDNRNISKGVYGFNSLLVGLYLGISFSPGIILYVIILLASVMTLFIAVSMQGVIGKYGLPFLSVPFLIGAWTLTLATRDMEFLGISERGIFILNDLYTLGGNSIVRLYEWWNNLGIAKPLKIYFISLGAILFQYNVLSGIIISLGILYYSRISFTLSLLGFFTAYLFYDFVGADISEMNYSYIGFNYILTSIAVGGFFIVPSLRSYFWSMLIVPIVAILTLSLTTLFTSVSLPLYSLPFNLVVLLFIYVLKFRLKPSLKLSEVVIQQNSPEKNLYSFQNYIARFKPDLLPFQLPFYGIWTVSQGYDGVHTHKGEWQHALDFNILDNNGNQFSGEGNNAEDYYCFNKPVLAPADGYVESVADSVEDNLIGKVNIKENWGNSIVIRHNNNLFTSLSHLRNGSITVKTGDRVRQGDIIAKCGNSGRSPYPHLHFQVQNSPFIGSPTVDHPISYFIEHSDKGFQMKSYAIPETGNKISNIEKNDLLFRAFEFIPGKTLCFEAEINGTMKREQWEINTNEFNQQYIKSNPSGAIAYFSNDGALFLFHHYTGKKDTLLYYFSLAAFRVQLGFYKEIEFSDYFPLNLTFHNSLLFLQDFVAPFYKFLKSEFKIRYDYIDNEVFTTRIRLASSATNLFTGHSLTKLSFVINLDENGISGFEIDRGGTKINALICTDQLL